MILTPNTVHRRSGPSTSKSLARQILGLKLEPIQKWDFYDAVMSDDHVLTIQTGDQALWANVLLTIGCRVS